MCHTQAERGRVMSIETNWKLDFKAKTVVTYASHWATCVDELLDTSQADQPGVKKAGPQQR